ncbi:MAG: hypothetical protein IJK81_08335 [Selenomonadaceae bacterium]|nr:hypothetical protein [Selenomonadaceae bacterium]
MKENYSRPKITNAGALSDPEGLLPVVEALTKGYGAGRAVRKVFSGDFSPSSEAGLVKRKEFKD